MRIQRKKYSRLWVYLLYLGLVTSLILVMTLARYASTAGGTGAATVAAMAGGGKPIQMVLDDMVPGGEPRTLQFQVVNYKDGAISQVALDYEILVETTGNLPLRFTLTAAEETGTVQGGTTVETGAVLENGDGARAQTLSGGCFPIAEAGTGNTLTKQAHTYTLTVMWPKDKSEAGYADEIDLVTVSVTARQRLAGES